MNPTSPKARRHRPRSWVRFGTWLAAALAGIRMSAAEPALPASNAGPSTGLDAGATARPSFPSPPRGFEVFHRVTSRVYSGSQPDGDAAFAALADLGIRTVVSVDGTRPDVEVAHRHGLRYVHVPFGYDGIPPQRMAELAAILNTVSGPVFVHCHHGRHRGPAAVAVMCLSGEGWTADRAETWMKEAGTSTDYPGLYRAVREFRTLKPGRIIAVRDLPEVAKVPPMVESMVTLDQHLDRLKDARRHAWKPTDPRDAPVNHATLLWENLRELGRHADTANRPAEYRRHLATSEAAADALRKALLPGGSPAGTTSLDAAFQELAQSCSVCHKSFRN